MAGKAVTDLQAADGRELDRLGWLHEAKRTWRVKVPSSPSQENPAAPAVPLSLLHSETMYCRKRLQNVVNHLNSTYPHLELPPHCGGERDGLRGLESCASKTQG